MAPRKDMMRIIRQDAGFSAKLGFGEVVAQSAAAPEAGKADILDADMTATAGEASTAEIVTAAALIAGPAAVAQSSADQKAPAEIRKPAIIPKTKRAELHKTESVVVSAARGQVVYVSVSLTAPQAARAEAWAAVAKCSVQFLIRRVAQALRDEVFDDWEQNGMPEVDEPRGVRGKHPTSVTFTLRQEFAAALSAQHDPLGIMGLGRTMGPAFRARFQMAFDDALAKAKIQSVSEGDEN